MEPEQQRIEEDLRGVLRGEVRCDDLFVQLYASDASIYQLRPLGVVRPRSVEDVVRTVQYAAENELPLHARGAGSGLAGESLGRGLIVDFSRFFRRILETKADEVRVEAGVVLATLNRHLSTQGRVFGPDPAMSQITTMGSVVAIDASGSHWLHYGSAGRHIRSIRAVMADGEVVEFSRHRVGANGKNEDPPRIRQLVDSVTQLVEHHASTIDQYRPQSVINRSGYHLDAFLQDGHAHLARLLAGSEGTLALVTDVTLGTDPLPSHRGCALMLFESLDRAAQASVELAHLGPSACDLMDRRHLTLARQSDPRYEFLIPSATEAVLLVEFFADTAEELHSRLDETVEHIQYRTQLAAGVVIALDAEDNELFWNLARQFVPSLHALRGSTRAIPCVEDIAVPPAALPVFLRHVHDTLKQRQVTASIFGHAGHGQLHIRPFLDLSKVQDVRKMEALADELYEKVWLLGGTISGEHGDGLSRTPFLSRQYGMLVNVFRELKQIFDPQGILNPGKIVPSGSLRITHNLRRITARLSQPVGQTAPTTPSDSSPPLPPIDLQLDWKPEEIALAARACNGCGACRTHSTSERMCPIFRFAPREEASPRAKANLVRSLVTGTLSQGQFLQESCKEISDLCVHCHMCRLECPASVDIPKLMLEAKAMYVETNGLTIQDWLLTRIDALSGVAGKFPAAANWALSNPQARWVLERILGIAQGRKLPQLARRNFLRWATLRRMHRMSQEAGEKVLYFVDTYANHFDPELAEALVTVLRHHGIPVYVPPDQRHCAMPMISQGALGPARRTAEHNVALLAEAVRSGYTIVATEPSAALALTHEYPTILDDDDDARLVAEHTHEAGHYLWQLHQRGQLKLDFQPLRVSAGYHAPCHLRALGAGTPTENLLRLIPELRVNRLEKGCSGMAGMLGIKQKNYRSSLRAGFELISTMRHGSFQIGTTECSTCKIQMEQSTTKPTIHPVKLLAMAYGRMPELRARLKKQGKPLVVT